MQCLGSLACAAFVEHAAPQVPSLAPRGRCTSCIAFVILRKNLSPGDKSVVGRCINYVIKITKGQRGNLLYQDFTRRKIKGSCEFVWEYYGREFVSHLQRKKWSKSDTSEAFQPPHSLPGQITLTVSLWYDMHGFECLTLTVIYFLLFIFFIGGFLEILCRFCDSDTTTFVSSPLSSTNN